MRQFLIAGSMLPLLLLNGCTSHTEAGNGFDTKTRMENRSKSYIEALNTTVIQNETGKAISTLLHSRFVQQYCKQQTSYDTTRRPLLQIGSLENKTNDPSFKMDVIMDTLCTEIVAAGILDITIATGTANSQYPLADKLLREAPRKQGSLELPDLSLDGYVASVSTGIAPNQKKGLFLSLKLYDLCTGKMITSSCRTIPLEPPSLSENQR